MDGIELTLHDSLSRITPLWSYDKHIYKHLQLVQSVLLNIIFFHDSWTYKFKSSTTIILYICDEDEEDIMFEDNL